MLRCHRALCALPEKAHRHKQVKVFAIVDARMWILLGFHGERKAGCCWACALLLIETRVVEKQKRATSLLSKAARRLYVGLRGTGRVRVHMIIATVHPQRSLCDQIQGT